MNDIHEIARIVNESGLGLKEAYKAGIISATDKTISKQLKEAGYTYDRGSKLWILADETAPAVTDPVTDNLTSLTDAELVALKGFARQLIQNNATKQYDSIGVELYKRTLAINKDGRDRKTYMINRSVSEQFDKIATRVNLDKSDLLEIALVDFIKNYGEN